MNAYTTSFKVEGSRHTSWGEPSIERIAELRVRIEYQPWDGVKPHSVLITHNGYQWSGFSLVDINDIALLRDQLNEYIEEHQRREV